MEPEVQEIWVTTPLNRQHRVWNREERFAPPTPSRVYAPQVNLLKQRTALRISAQNIRLMQAAKWQTPVSSPVEHFPEVGYLLKGMKNGPLIAIV